MNTERQERVELHCHTKMSEMDGVTDIRDLLDQAIMFGHRAVAITDHGSVQAFIQAYYEMQEIQDTYVDPGESLDFKLLYGMEAYLADDIRKYAVVMIAASEEGRINLYRLISASAPISRDRDLCISKSDFLAHRDGLLIGSVSPTGEVYQAVLSGRPEEELAQLAAFYDYLEIQPDCCIDFLRESGNPSEQRYSAEELHDMNKKIVELGEKCTLPVVATGNVHFLDSEDVIYRKIVKAANDEAAPDSDAPLFFRTTEEMLEEFAYLGEEKAEEVVIANTNLIADRCECITPLMQGRYLPVMENSDQELRDICYEKAREWYGETLPGQVSGRLEYELDCIISNGHSVIYKIAGELVRKSKEDGYPVGLRGCGASSLAAMLMGITEINPLEPHYLCADCHYSDFDFDVGKGGAGQTGYELPDKICPVCGAKLTKQGFDIPFECFLGLNGDKEPVFDLNFAVEYQEQAIHYVQTLLGKDHVFRAGTVGTLSYQEAYDETVNYCRKHHIHLQPDEMEEIAGQCTEVKCSQELLPGGIIIVPDGQDINMFTPVRPTAYKGDLAVTHFNHYSIDNNLLEMDLFGHYGMSMLHMLRALTGLDPMEIPLDNPEVMSLFRNTSALHIKPEDIGGCTLGTLGIPEFGTDFAMQILRDTEPKGISDFIRVSALCHGTDVWHDNAQTLIQEGIADISSVIGTRDDIMLYLINRGIDREQAFKIMEAVRRGRDTWRCEMWDEWKQDMLDHDVPQWYICSCEKILYLFPKSHVAAYVTMALRIAYYKVFYPLAFYAAYFTFCAEQFPCDIMCRGKENLERHRNKLERHVNKLREKKLTRMLSEEEDTLCDLFYAMQVAQEMYARGYEFVPMDALAAKEREFQIIDGKLMPPLNAGRMGEEDEGV